MINLEPVPNDRRVSFSHLKHAFPSIEKYKQACLWFNNGLIAEVNVYMTRGGYMSIEGPYEDDTCRFRVRLKRKPAG